MTMSLWRSVSGKEEMTASTISAWISGELNGDLLERSHGNLPCVEEEFKKAG